MRRKFLSLQKKTFPLIIKLLFSSLRRILRTPKAGINSLRQSPLVGIYAYRASREIEPAVLRRKSVCYRLMIVLLACHLVGAPMGFAGQVLKDDTEKERA